MTAPPSSPEGLRLRRRRIGLAWLMVRAKHTTQAWLRESVVDSFLIMCWMRKLRACAQRMWSLVLKYEAERCGRTRTTTSGQARRPTSGMHEQSLSRARFAGVSLCDTLLPGCFQVQPCQRWLCRICRVFRCRRSLCLLGPEKGPARAAARIPARARVCERLS